MQGLKTFSIADFEAGKKMHRIIQDHCSGVTHNDLLTQLPKFSLVETEDFDQKMKIEFDVNDKYSLRGYVDMKDPETRMFGEIKSGGKSWTAGEFARHPQWKIYALAMPEYTKAWLISVPKDDALWSRETIRVFNKDITDEDKKQAKEFIDQGIHIIENIRDAIDREQEEKRAKGYTGRSRYCFYVGCDWCENK
jgi:hypothetical protein